MCKICKFVRSTFFLKNPKLVARRFLFLSIFFNLTICYISLNPKDSTVDSLEGEVRRILQSLLILKRILILQTLTNKARLFYVHVLRSIPFICRNSFVSIELAGIHEIDE